MTKEAETAEKPKAEKKAPPPILEEGQVSIIAEGQEIVFAAGQMELAGMPEATCLRRLAATHGRLVRGGTTGAGYKVEHDLAILYWFSTSTRNGLHARGMVDDETPTLLMLNGSTGEVALINGETFVSMSKVISLV